VDQSTDLLNSPEVCEQAGITYRMLDHWTRCGYLRPERPAAGHGTQRGYSPAEVVVARRMVQLTRVGFAPATAAHAARNGYTTWLEQDVKVSIWSLP
jgi:DNA-binding transcriptional MerR regulator